jgi:hypothetical protein
MSIVIAMLPAVASSTTIARMIHVPALLGGFVTTTGGASVGGLGAIRGSRRTDGDFVAKRPEADGVLVFAGSTVRRPDVDGVFDGNGTSGSEPSFAVSGSAVIVMGTPAIGVFKR